MQLFSDHVEAHDLDGTKVQIPYTTDDKAAIKEAIEEFGICTSAPGKQILQKGRDPEHEKGEHKYTE